MTLYSKEKAELVNEETQQIWKKYVIDMELRELSDSTIDQYRNDLFQWWIYVMDNQDNRSVLTLDDDDLTEFFWFCKKSGNNSRRMRRRMASMSAFYKFLRKKKMITDNPMDYVDRPTKDTDVVEQTFLTMEQVELMRDRLNEKVDDEKNTNIQKHAWMTIRCYAFFSLSTMARVSAVASVKWEQFDFENRIVCDVREKEGYIVDLYFSEEVKRYLQELKEFRKANGVEDGGYVFASVKSFNSNHTPATTMGMWCKRIGKLIDVPSLHPHDFRHSGSQLMLLAGASVEQISNMLNHKGLDVTKKHYLRTDKSKIQETHDKFCI